MDWTIRRNLQKDYEAIEDFSTNWVQRLADKYNISRDEVLNNIDF